MDYRTIADLAACIRTRLPERMPRDIDLVVGIPHGGMVAASLFALRFSLPVTDVEGYLARRDRMGPTSRAKHILLVDDSVTTGLRCEAARKTVSATSERHGDRITTLAVYGVPGASGGCDITVEHVPLPRLFEWSYMHHAILSDSCLAFDGVLCPERGHSTENAASYRAFLKAVCPLIRPSVELGSIIACHPEKHRKLTEDWLRSHGVPYRHLILMDAPPKSAEAGSDSRWRFKVEAFTRACGRLFVESSPVDAQAIAEQTRLPVLCTGLNQMLCSDRNVGVRPETQR